MSRVSIDDREAITQSKSWSAVVKSDLQPEESQTAVYTNSIVPQRNQKLCPFDMAGKCKYGENCRYLHGIKCPICEKYCLHPFRPEEHSGGYPN